MQHSYHKTKGSKVFHTFDDCERDMTIIDNINGLTKCNNCLRREVKNSVAMKIPRTKNPVIKTIRKDSKPKVNRLIEVEKKYSGVIDDPLPKYLLETIFNNKFYNTPIRSDILNSIINIDFSGVNKAAFCAKLNNAFLNGERMRVSSDEIKIINVLLSPKFGGMLNELVKNTGDRFQNNLKSLYVIV